MNATHFAEQATLGSLLLDPSSMADISGWLRAEDFAHPWHQAVFAVIRERHQSGPSVDPMSVGHAMTERLGHRRADLPRMLTLLQAAPVRPQPKRYASMVLASSLRREVAGHGVLLQAAALSASIEGHSRPVTRITALVAGTLDAAEQRWCAAVGTGARTWVDPGDSTAVASLRDTAVSADRFLQAHPPLDHDRVAAHEEELVAALVSHPSHVHDLATWLRPDTVTNPAWRPVYAALVQLTELDEPVDAMTVAWEVHRTSARLGQGPGTRALRDSIDLAAAADPRYLARAVAGDHLQLIAAQGAGALRTAAANPGLDLVDVLHSGHLITDTLRDTARGMPDHATQAPPVRHLSVARDLEVRRPEQRLGLTGPVAG